MEYAKVEKLLETKENLEDRLSLEVTLSWHILSNSNDKISYLEGPSLNSYLLKDILAYDA